MRFTSLVRSLVALLMLSLVASSAVASEINACKYLVVTEFTSDPYGIAKELRRQASAKGLIVVSAVTEVSPADLLKTCVMCGSWSREAFSGQLSIRVVDAPSGALMAEGNAGATDWWSVTRTVRGAVAKIYSQLGYTGYNENVYQQRVEWEYPPRPKLAITERKLGRASHRIT